MTIIGINFASELRAAGIGNGLSFSVGASDVDIQGRAGLSAADQATLDQVIAAHVPGHPALDIARAHALDSINAAAETARYKHLTPGSGQAMSYREKAAEAAACLATYTAAAPPAAGTYPLLDSEIGITPSTATAGVACADAYDVAAAVDAARQTWIAAEAAINAVRVKAKADIKNATTTAEIDTIMAAIVWP